MMKAMNFICIKENRVVWTTKQITKLICLNGRLATDSVHNQEWTRWRGFKGNKGHVQLQLELTKQRERIKTTLESEDNRFE